MINRFSKTPGIGIVRDDRPFKALTINQSIAEASISEVYWFRGELGPNHSAVGIQNHHRDLIIGVIIGLIHDGRLIDIAGLNIRVGNPDSVKLDIDSVISISEDSLDCRKSTGLLGGHRITIHIIPGSREILQDEGLGIGISTRPDEIAEGIIPERHRNILNNNRIPLGIKEQKLRSWIKNGNCIRRRKVEAELIPVLKDDRSDDIIEGHIDVASTVERLPILGRTRRRIRQIRSCNIYGERLDLFDIRIAR